MSELEVTLTDAAGQRRDVTFHPATRIDALTPWSVVVEDSARLRFEPDVGFDRMAKQAKSWAIVQVLHQDASSGSVGRAMLTLVVEK